MKPIFLLLALSPLLVAAHGRADPDPGYRDPPKRVNAAGRVFLRSTSAVDGSLRDLPFLASGDRTWRMIPGGLSARVAARKGEVVKVVAQPPGYYSDVGPNPADVPVAICVRDGRGPPEPISPSAESGTVFGLRVAARDGAVMVGLCLRSADARLGYPDSGQLLVEVLDAR